MAIEINHLWVTTLSLPQGFPLAFVEFWQVDCFQVSAEAHDPHDHPWCFKEHGILELSPCGGFLKWWYPTTMGFPTENDQFWCVLGYHHFRKHPFGNELSWTRTPMFLFKLPCIGWLILRKNNSKRTGETVKHSDSETHRCSMMFVENLRRFHSRSIPGPGSIKIIKCA